MAITIPQNKSCQQFSNNIFTTKDCEKGEITHLPRCIVNLDPYSFFVLCEIASEITRYYRKNGHNPRSIDISMIDYAKRLGLRAASIKKAILDLESNTYLGFTSIETGRKTKVFPNYLKWEDMQKSSYGIGQRSGVLKIPVALISEFKGKPTYFKVLVCRISNSHQFNMSLSTGREAKLFGISRKHLNTINRYLVENDYISQIRTHYRGKFHLNHAEVNRYHLTLMARGVINVRQKNMPEICWDGILENEEMYSAMSNSPDYYLDERPKNSEPNPSGYSKPNPPGSIKGILKEQQVKHRKTCFLKQEKTGQSDIMESQQHNIDKPVKKIRLVENNSYNKKDNLKKIKNCYPQRSEKLTASQYRRLCYVIRYLMPIGTTWRPITEKFKNMFFSLNIDAERAISWLEIELDHLGDFPIKYRESKEEGLISAMVDYFN